ncbi:hypothetical protein [Paenibacillus sp. A51L]
MFPKKALIYASVLLVSSSIGVFTAHASDSDKFCSVTKGSFFHCINTLSKSDSLANFSNKMDDYIEAPDAYTIKFNHVELSPNVTRGDSVYKSYTLSDNKNQKFYTYNDYNGYHMADYSLIRISINKSTGYYPASYQQPVSQMDMANSPSIVCSGATAIFCRTYTQASQHSVN